MNIIFLDIDGVLNSDEFFNEERLKIIEEFNSTKLNNKNLYMIDDFDLLADWAMLRIDFSKLELVKELANITDSNIVIISSWRTLEFYPFIEQRLKELGLPIVGKIEDEIKKDSFIRYDRGKGIKDYLKNKQVNNYIILDDETRDYDKILLNRLIQTDYRVGLTIKNINKSITMLSKKGENKYGK